MNRREIIVGAGALALVALPVKVAKVSWVGRGLHAALSTVVSPITASLFVSMYARKFGTNPASHEQLVAFLSTYDSSFAFHRPYPDISVWTDEVGGTPRIVLISNGKHDPQGSWLAWYGDSTPEGRPNVHRSACLDFTNDGRVIRTDIISEAGLERAAETPFGIRTAFETSIIWRPDVDTRENAYI